MGHPAAKQFEGIVKNLLHTKPIKREDVKVSKKKPEKNLAAEVTRIQGAQKSC